MNRIIKFRGKRLDNGQWVYGSLLNIEDTCFIIEKGDFDFDYRTENHAFWFDCTEKEVNPDTVGQFTGLLDRNGKEIYEGDIVRDKKGTVDVITYDSLAFNLCIAYASSPNGVCATFFGDNNPLRDLEVIGNIHDNPDLLNGK